ncbi:MAG: hypothetical protein KGY48_13135 [Wenzhouxiangellaceae bacterium]|nr:hypothetical protein [Wenzhouxiangellaceae bacterium]
MTNNLEVRYLYRDGANNKKCQSVVLANPDDITPEQLQDAIRSRFRYLQVWPGLFLVAPEPEELDRPLFLKYPGNKTMLDIDPA